MPSALGGRMWMIVDGWHIKNYIPRPIKKNRKPWEVTPSIYHWVGGFKYMFFYVHPDLIGEDEPILTIIFFKMGW